MAKFCGKCGAQLSDEMIFCNKCGARYREAQASNPQPVPMVSNISAPSATVNAVSSQSKVWGLIAFVLTLATALVFVFTPIVSVEDKEELIYGDEYYGYYTEDVTYEDTVSVLEAQESCWDDVFPLYSGAWENQYGFDKSIDYLNDWEECANELEIDGFDTIEIIVYVVLAVCAVAAVLVALPLVKQDINPSIGYAAVVAQMLALGGGAFLVFIMIKNTLQEVFDKLNALLGSNSGTVSTTFSMWGWIFLCAGALAILATIKAVQSSKSANTNFNAPRPY